MVRTRLDLRLSTDDQYGCHLATIFSLTLFFSEFPRNPVYIGFRGLGVY